MTAGRTLTPDQIERHVERMMDHLDRVFLSGGLTQRNYDLAIRDLNRWADAAYGDRGHPPPC